MNGKCSSPIALVALIAVDFNARLRPFGQADHFPGLLLSIVYARLERQKSENRSRRARGPETNLAHVCLNITLINGKHPLADHQPEASPWDSPDRFISEITGGAVDCKNDSRASVATGSQHGAEGSTACFIDRPHRFHEVSGKVTRPEMHVNPAPAYYGAKRERLTNRMLRRQQLKPATTIIVPPLRAGECKTCFY